MLGRGCQPAGLDTAAVDLLDRPVGPGGRRALPAHPDGRRLGRPARARAPGAAATVSEVTLYVTLSAAALAIICGALVKVALDRSRRRRRKDVRRWGQSLPDQRTW